MYMVDTLSLAQPPLAELPSPWTATDPAECRMQFRCPATPRRD